MLRPLFSMAPMLKSFTATIMKMVEVVFAAEDLLVPLHRTFSALSMACCALSMFSGST